MGKKIHKLVHTGILYRYPRAEYAKSDVEKAEAINSFLERYNVKQFIQKNDEEEFFVIAERTADCMMVSLLQKVE